MYVIYELARIMYIIISYKKYVLQWVIMQNNVIFKP